MNKRITAWLLVLALALSCLTAGALAAENGGRADLHASELNQPEWPNEGAVHLNKKAQPTGEANEYEVTLTIQGKNFKTTSDVVLVIDNSNSMYVEDNVSNDRMVKTKQAAKAFVEELLTAESSTRIALVVFGSNVRSYTGFYDVNGKAELLSKIEAISKESENSYGATNQQAGIHKAQELLSSADSTGKLKNIVILSDGEPTFCYEVRTLSEQVGYTTNIKSNCGIGRHKTPTVALKAKTPTGDGATITSCDYSDRNIIGTGGSIYLNYGGEYYSYNISVDSYFNHPAITGSWSCSHLTMEEATWDYAIAENNSNGAKPSTVRITGKSNATQSFSTKATSTLQVTNAGQSTIWEANTIKAAGTTIYSVALMAGTTGEKVIRALATDPTEGKGFFHITASDDVSQKLTSAFDTIAGSIAIAASNGSVSDPMSEYVDLVMKGSTPVVTNDESAYNAGNADLYISQGSLTWDADRETIAWTVGNINEGVPAVLRYKVRIMDNTVKTGDMIPTNGRTTFTYTDYLGDNTTKDFDVPDVVVGGGTIRVHTYLVDENGNPLSSDGQIVEAPQFAMEMNQSYYFTADGSTALNLNTPYSVPHPALTDASYYGYTLDGWSAGHTVTKADSAPMTLTLTSANQEVWFAYTMSFQVGHVQAGKETTYTTHTVTSSFDLTAQVTQGCLYGGAFTGEACTAGQTQTFAAGRSAMDFAPSAGKTYYIWEVSEKYLKPANYCLWNANNGQKDVVGLYVLTPVDRLVYREVGFDVEGAVNVSQKDGESIAYGVVDFTRDGSVYEEIYVKDGALKSKKGGTVAEADRDAGYIGLSKLSGAQFEAFKKNGGVTFAPYWITLDGVKVTAYTRTMKYRGLGYSNAEIVTSGPNASMTLAQSSNQTLRFAAAFNSDYDETEQPVEPVEPTEPVTGTVTLTIHDNGKTTERPVQKGDLTGTLGYDAPAGKLFAGWYLDEACRTAADLKNVQEDLELYAKYVSSAYLQQRMVSQFTLSGRKVSILSAVEKGDYAETGLMVNGEKVVVEKYVKRYGIYNGRNLFGLSSSTPLMRWELDLKGYKVGEKLTVTPYWVTADGTVVSGASRSYTVTRLGLQG